MRLLKLVGLVALSITMGCQETDPPTVVCPPPPSQQPPRAAPEPAPCESGQVVLDAVFDQDDGRSEHEAVVSLPSDGELCLSVHGLAPPRGLGGVLRQCGRLDWERSTSGPSSAPDGSRVRAGDVLTSSYAPLAIRAWRDAEMTDPGLPVAFDTESPTGGDSDLASDDLGVVVISQETFSPEEEAEGFVVDPDDDARGAVLELAFPARACVQQVGLLDIDDNETATVSLLDGAGRS